MIMLDEPSLETSGVLQIFGYTITLDSNPSYFPTAL